MEQDETPPSSPAAPAPLLRDWSPSLPEEERRLGRRARALLLRLLRPVSRLLVLLALVCAGPLASSLLAFFVASSRPFRDAQLLAPCYGVAFAAALLALRMPARPRASTGLAVVVAVPLGLLLSAGGWWLGDALFDPKGLMAHTLQLAHSLFGTPMFVGTALCLFRRA